MIFSLDTYLNKKDIIKERYNNITHKWWFFFLKFWWILAVYFRYFKPVPFFLFFNILLVINMEYWHFLSQKVNFGDLCAKTVSQNVKYLYPNLIIYSELQKSPILRFCPMAPFTSYETHFLWKKCEFFIPSITIANVLIYPCCSINYPPVSFSKHYLTFLFKIIDTYQK